MAESQEPDTTHDRGQAIIVSAGDRPFAASALALQALIIDSQERVLLMSNPVRGRGWQVVSGALENGETLLEGVLRETKEEAGEEIKVRPLGVVHAESFHYDSQVRFMVGIYYLLAYEGGAIKPGDDMVGSEFRWWSMEEVDAAGLKLHPSTKRWMLRRAVQLYRLWRDEPMAPLQPVLEA